MVALEYRNLIARVAAVAQWSFLTNHARVLLCIAHDPGLRLRDMADELGITERSAFAIVSDLTEAGYVVKERDGRRNRYSIQRHMPLPDSTGRERTVGEVLNLLADRKSRPRSNGHERSGNRIRDPHFLGPSDSRDSRRCHRGRSEVPFNVAVTAPRDEPRVSQRFEESAV